MGITAPVGGEQYRHRRLPHQQLLGRPAALAQAKATVGLAAGAVAPHPLKLGHKSVCQLTAAQAQQVVDVAAAAVGPRIAVDAGGGEIG